MGRKKKLKYHIVWLQFSWWRRVFHLVGCASKPAGERRETLGFMESGYLKGSFRQNIETLLKIFQLSMNLEKKVIVMLPPTYLTLDRVRSILLLCNKNEVLERLGGDNILSSPPLWAACVFSLLRLLHIDQVVVQGFGVERLLWGFFFDPSLSSPTPLLPG